MSNKGDIQATILQGLLKGEKGDPGEKGVPGERGETGAVPVKGVDYWTEEDQEQLVTETLETLEESIETSTDPITADDKLIMAIAGALAKVDYTLLAKAIVEQYSGNDFGDYNAPNQTLQRAITKLLNVVESGQRRFINTMDDLNNLATAFEQGSMSLPASISPTGSSMTCTYITSCSTRSTSRTLDITDLATGKRYVTRRENLSSAWAEWKEIPVTNWPDSDAALGENDSLLVSRSGEFAKFDYNLFVKAIVEQYSGTVFGSETNTIKNVLDNLIERTGTLRHITMYVSRKGGYNNPTGTVTFNVASGCFAKMYAYTEVSSPAESVHPFIEGLVRSYGAGDMSYVESVNVGNGVVTVDSSTPNKLSFYNPYTSLDFRVEFLMFTYNGNGIYE